MHCNCNYTRVRLRPQPASPRRLVPLRPSAAQPKFGPTIGTDDNLGAEAIG